MTAVPESPFRAVPEPPLGGVSTPPADHHRHRRRSRRRSGYHLTTVAVVAAWVGVVLAAPQLSFGPGLHTLALFGHLVALLVGFGAVLTVEWFGLLWLLGRRPLVAVVQTANGAHLLIWLGLAGLAVTGVVLAPPRLSPLTMVKLAAVLVVALNGIQVRRVQRRLVECGPAVPRPLLVRAGLTALVSQAGWWTATVIGFLNSQS